MQVVKMIFLLLFFYFIKLKEGPQQWNADKISWRMHSLVITYYYISFNLHGELLNQPLYSYVTTCLHYVLLNIVQRSKR